MYVKRPKSFAKFLRGTSRRLSPLAPLSQHRNVFNTNLGKRTLGMPDTQKFGPQTFPKYKADIFDMVQNALEENNMTKAKVYMWKSVIEIVGRKRNCLSMKNLQKPHKQSQN